MKFQVKTNPDDSTIESIQFDFAIDINPISHSPLLEYMWDYSLHQVKKQKTHT